MRKAIAMFLALMVALVFAVPALAEYSGTATGIVGTGTTESVVRLPSDTNGYTRVVAYSIISSSASHTHDATVLYSAQNYVPTAATVTGQTHVYVSTTGWTAGDIIAFQTPSGSGVIHTWVVAVNAGNLHVAAAPSANYLALTTRIHRMSASATIGLSGTSTAQTATNSTGVLIAPKGSPIIISYYGGQIQYVTYKIF